jgi:nucleoside-diphosphate-sugar epimerase
MKALVTGSSGHLGEALVRTITDIGGKAVGLDIKPSRFTKTAAPS